MQQRARPRLARPLEPERRGERRARGATSGGVSIRLRPAATSLARREPHAGVAPLAEARPRPLLVEPSGGILDERDPPTAAEQAHDRGVVADVGRDAEEDHLGRVERIEHRLGVRVREDVEALLQQQDLAAAGDELADEPGG